MMVELVLDAKATLAEGPLWDAKKQCLYWLDILENEVHIYDPATRADRSIRLDQHIGALALTKDGGAIVALQKGIYFLDLDTERISLICSPEAHLTNNRFNDGKCDSKGRFWAGTMSMDENEGNGGSQPAGALYCLEGNGHVRKAFGGVTISNGIAWSPDDRIMYYIDSPTKQVTAFDFDALTGELANKRTVVAFAEAEGIPDGMTIDEDGMIWVAHWGGYQVSRWNPSTGRKLLQIDVPVRNVTSCAFGGKHLDELYITTSSIGVTEAEKTG